MGFYPINCDGKGNSLWIGGWASPPRGAGVLRSRGGPLRAARRCTVTPGHVTMTKSPAAAEVLRLETFEAAQAAWSCTAGTPWLARVLTLDRPAQRATSTSTSSAPRRVSERPPFGQETSLRIAEVLAEDHHWEGEGDESSPEG